MTANHGACDNITESTRADNIDFGLFDPFGNITANSEKYGDFYKNAQFITGLILYPIVCLFGLSGNSLSIIVLSQRTMRTPTNIYLISLAISDSIKLLNDVLYFLSILVQWIHPHTGTLMFAKLYPFAHYFQNMPVLCSAWITVSVAAERYLLVCKPATAKRASNFQTARRACVATFAISTLLTLPFGFRYKTVAVQCGGIQTVAVVVTELWRNEMFVLVYTWIHSLLRTVVPILIVSTMNYFIIRSLKRSRSRSGSRRSSMHRITIMLISVIVVFVVCVTPDAVMSTVFGYGYVEATALVRGIREITDLLLLVNSAVNFVLYCTFNYVFRKNFVALFCDVAETNHNAPPDVAPGGKRKRSLPKDQSCIASAVHMYDYARSSSSSKHSSSNGSCSSSSQINIVKEDRPSVTPPPETTSTKASSSAALTPQTESCDEKSPFLTCHHQEAEARHLDLQIMHPLPQHANSMAFIDSNDHGTSETSFIDTGDKHKVNIEDGNMATQIVVPTSHGDTGCGTNNQVQSHLSSQGQIKDFPKEGFAGEGQAQILVNNRRNYSIVKEMSHGKEDSDPRDPPPGSALAYSRQHTPVGGAAEKQDSNSKLINSLAVTTNQGLTESPGGGKNNASATRNGLRVLTDHKQTNGNAVLMDTYAKLTKYHLNNANSHCIEHFV